MFKIAPKMTRICPGCPHKDLNLEGLPSFKVADPVQETSKKVSIIDNRRKTKKYRLW